MIMLFDDAVLLAVKGAYDKLFPVGPTEGFSAVLSNPNAEVVVSKCCADARNISKGMLIETCRFGGMNDFHAHAALEDTKVLSF